MSNPLSQLLEKIGLSELEGRIYVCLLSHLGGLFVHEITKKTDIHRSNIVVALQKMTEKGYVSYYTDGSRKKYQAVSPDKILNQYKDDIHQLESLLPLLIGTHQPEEQTKIRFFEGSEGIRKIHHDIRLVAGMLADEDKEILTISSGADMFRVVEDHMESHVQKRIRSNIPLRWIAPRDSFNTSFIDTTGEQLRTMKFFDAQQFPFYIELDIYGSSIAIMNLEYENPTGVIIENSRLANSLRSVFNMLWMFLSVSELSPTNPNNPSNRIPLSM